MNKFFVRTTGKRQINYDLDYEVLCDPVSPPVDSFINQLKHISDYDAVLLEDDLVLCENFKEEIEKAISLYPNKIINFFTDINHYYSTYVETNFNFNQCTYYPKGIAKMLAEEMEKCRKNLPTAQYDVLQHYTMNKLGITHVKYRPCLVQHLDFDTLIQEQTYNRRCIYFIDYLKELNIEYEDAYLPENRKKLEQQMNKHIKTLQGEVKIQNGR